MRRPFQRVTASLDGSSEVAPSGEDRLTVRLKPRELVGIENASGAVVRVETGQLWITQADDTRDYVVDAGHAMRLDRDGLALITAILPSKLTVTPGAAARVDRILLERRRRAA